MVVDEIHKLKNVTKGKRSANILKLAKKTEDGHLALLSGTPVPNKIKDLAMILRMLLIYQNVL